MREHMGLFRGKRIDNGEWVQGCLITPTSEFLQHKAFIAESLYCGAVCDTSHSELMLGGFAEVDPTTIGECTSLRDKNGKLIFEGDIVAIPSSKRAGLPAAIRYNRNGASFEIGRVGFNPISLWDANEWCEIIGNIHDNPELKGGEG